MNMKVPKFIKMAAAVIAVAFAAGCSGGESGMTADDLKATASMSVTSDDLQGGQWADDISSAAYGKNESPQLTISGIPSAESYAVYMLDESADNWQHWFLTDLKETELERGADVAGSFYKGPYPPGGTTHTYTVYVFAMKGAPDGGYPNSFDSPFMSASELLEEHLDIAGGQKGNVIAYGYISGEFTHRG